MRWRVLPERLRKTLLGPRVYPLLADSLHEIFDGVPEVSQVRVRDAILRLGGS